MKPPGKPKKRVLYVEGGGDHNSSLASECRRAFSMLFDRAGITRKAGVVACGGRRSAYEQFCTAHAEGKDEVWLLVDAEAPAPSAPPFDPWAHVKARKGDGWDRPGGATDDQLHFMNVVMETWLLADRDALKKVFGPKLDEKELPPEGPGLESHDKPAVYRALKEATRPTPSEGYGKGQHAFRILAEVSPAKLRALPWADRLLKILEAP